MQQEANGGAPVGCSVQWWSWCFRLCASRRGDSFLGNTFLDTTLNLICECRRRFKFGSR